MTVLDAENHGYALRKFFGIPLTAMELDSNTGATEVDDDSLFLTSNLTGGNVERSLVVGCDIHNITATQRHRLYPIASLSVATTAVSCTLWMMTGMFVCIEIPPKRFDSFALKDLCHYCWQIHYLLSLSDAEEACETFGAKSYREMVAAF